MTFLRWTLAAVLAAALLAGCGGGTSVTPAGAPSASVPAGTSIATEPGSGASDRAVPAADPAGATGCGDPTPVRAALTGSEVTSVTVVGKCTSVVIGTSLPDTGSVLANQLCERAAEVAYTGEVTAVSVLGASKRELSVGIKGAPCLAEP